MQRKTNLYRIDFCPFSAVHGSTETVDRHSSAVATITASATVSVKSSVVFSRDSNRRTVEQLEKGNRNQFS